MLLAWFHNILDPLRDPGSWWLIKRSSLGSHPGERTHLIEVGILRGCQAKATLTALKSHEAGQQAESDVHIIAKVVVHVVCYSPETVGQLLGFNCVEFSLVPLQALQLPMERKERIKQSSSSSLGNWDAAGPTWHRDDF